MAEKPEVTRLRDEELNQLAQDYHAGRVFTNQHVTSAYQVSLVFLPLALGGIPESVDHDSIGMIYEYVDQAGPSSINGMPMFMSYRVLHKADLELLIDKVKRIKQAVAAALTPEDAHNAPA
jgi:hypothetical protein